MFDRIFTLIAGRVAAVAGQPIAFILALTVIAVWGLTGPIFHYSDTWQLVVNTATTIVTFLMVFLIQNSQNRDSAAMQAKLDELLRAVRDARALQLEVAGDRMTETFTRPDGGRLHAVFRRVTQP